MNIHVQMISFVAEAMGPELLQEAAFVGGCTTGLLITDDFVKEQVRHTDDVDLIVHVVGAADIYNFQKRLSEKGFTHDVAGDSPICAMKLGQLRVDFTPDNSSYYGFTNRWYGEALETAAEYNLPNGVVIRLVRPDYFIATKFEAYKGRGNSDPLGSRDIEDILTLIDGREELMSELKKSPAALLGYMQKEFAGLIKERDFSYAVQSAASNDRAREDELFNRIERIIGGGF